MKAPSPLVKKLYQRLSFFSKVGQKSRSRPQGQHFWYREKSLVTRTHMLYESCISFTLKVIAKVKVTLDRQMDGKIDRGGGGMIIFSYSQHDINNEHNPCRVFGQLLKVKPDTP